MNEAVIRGRKSRAVLITGANNPSKRPEVRIKLSFNYSINSWKKTKPERVLLEHLDSSVFLYAGDNKRSYGQPISADIIAPTQRLIIQVDGCHWHECPQHGSGKYPDKRAQDEAKSRHAESLGWVVLRFWEHEILDDTKSVVDKILAVLEAGHGSEGIRSHG